MHQKHAMFAVQRFVQEPKVTQEVVILLYDKQLADIGLRVL